MKQSSSYTALMLLLSTTETEVLPHPYELKLCNTRRVIKLIAASSLFNQSKISGCGADSHCTTRTMQILCILTLYLSSR